MAKAKKKTTKKKVTKKVKKKKVTKKTRKVSGDKPLRDANGRLLPGQCGNPKGRPKGSKNKYSVAELNDAIKEVEEKKRKTFLVVWVESAWGDAKAMADVANFMMPKLRAIEQITISDDSMTDEEAEEIREEILKRFS